MPPRRSLLVLLLAAAAAAARAQQALPDDAEARMEAARALQEEQVTPAALIRNLRAAQRERDRAGRPTGSGALSRTALGRVPDGVWINLGPTRSDILFPPLGDAGPEGQIAGRVRNVVPHPIEPGVLFLATSGGGVWKTYDRGGSWEPLTDLTGSTSVGALAMDPQMPDILYLGLGDPFDAPQPGLTRTRDGGVTWDPIVFPTAVYGGAPMIAQRVRDIAVDPLGSAHVLVATDVGLFRWDGASPPVQLALPVASGGAAAWSIAWVGPDTWLVSGQGFDITPAGPVTQPLLRLWRSTDGGQTWTDALVGLPAQDLGDLGRGTLAVAPSTTRTGDGSRVFLLAANAQSGNARATKDLYRSEDGGRSWTALGLNSDRLPANPIASQRTLDILGGQANYNQAIAVDPRDANAVYVGGQLSMAGSQDGGQTWTILGEWSPQFSQSGLPYVHADLHAMAFSPADHQLYVGGDGGLFAADVSMADPRVVSISDKLNLGVVSHLVYHLACAPDAPGWEANQDFVVAGFQDNGTRLRDSLSPPGTFDQVVGGDGIGVAVSTAISAGVPAAILTTQPLHAIRRSTQGGAAGTWRTFMAGLPGSDTPSIPFFIQLVSDVSAPDGQTFVTFTFRPDRHVYRSSAGGAWTRIDRGAIHHANGASDGSFTDYAGTLVDFRYLAAHDKQPGVYAVAASAGTIFVTADSGANWWGSAILGTGAQQTRVGLKSSTGVAFDPTDPTGARYWAASEATTAFDTSLAVAANPPAQPVPDSLGHLFLTEDRGRTFRPVLGKVGTPGLMLPNVPIASLKADPNDANTLYVGTYVGLYKTTDGGQTFTRDPGLPLVKVTDICVAPGSSNMKVATYGRGIWQLNLGPGGLSGGARGRGDMDFNQQLDGFDLLDLVAAMGSTNQDPTYRQEADLVGTTNAVDEQDLGVFLQRVGGRP